MSIMRFQADAQASASAPKLAGDCMRLSDEGARRAAVMSEVRATFKPWGWELAKTLIYSLALPHSLHYHVEERGRLMPVFEEYERQLEWREGARIRAEMENKGYGNPDSAKYKQEYFRRMADAKVADDRYGSLSRRLQEHKNGMQSAAALFMACMIAWQVHLGLREAAFVAMCERIVRHLKLYFPVTFPANLNPDFTSVYGYMNDHFNATRKMRNEE